MINLLTDAFDNALSIADDLLGGQFPPRRRVAKLLADGFTVAAVATATGLAVDVVESIARDLGRSA